MFWIQGAKVSQESFAPPKPCFAPVQLSLAPVQEDFGALGPKHLLHPLLSTLGTFEVSGPCSKHSGSQNMSQIVVTFFSASPSRRPLFAFDGGSLQRIGAVCNGAGLIPLALRSGQNPVCSSGVCEHVP